MKLTRMPARLSGLAGAIEANPAKAFFIFAVGHVTVWTLLHTFLYRNLPYDVFEGIAYGKQWEWGYWKHPPLPWWLVDIVRRLTAPHLWGFFLIGELAAVGCFWAIWRLGREMLPPLEALVATVLLDGCIVFNIESKALEHNIVQLPFFGLAGWSLYRAFVAGKNLDWVLAGVWFGLALYAKYTVAILLLPLLVFAVVDPTARRCWATPGPYISMLIFAALVAPHIYWLVANNFTAIAFFGEQAPPLHGVWPVARSTAAYVVNAVLLVVPVFLMFQATMGALWRKPNPPLPAEAFARRYLGVLALGPLVITVVASVLLAREFKSSWSSQFWCFISLYLIVIWRLRVDRESLCRLIAAWAAITASLMAAQVASQILVIARSELVDTQFPGDRFAATLLDAWHRKTGKPLFYLAGARSKQAM